ncbi:MAG: Glu-tRNA(Gln) amidotransferase subunit GatE [Candidatus Hydrothermarchaeaceae archaeon]
MKLRIGFEIHQQLNTSKLFCECPSTLREDEADLRVERRLRPTQSELGEIDKAALEEFLKGRSYVYEAYSTSNCLVELDEEPPHPPNQEAIDIALEVALLLNAHPVDEVHFMRKIVIDGSNTSGFQRTAIVALDGKLDDGIRIPMIGLEEEAARRIKEVDGKMIYRLDRLGIPLVEITTSPDITTPQQAAEVARRLGELLRATGKVRRGLGTIRQDINVSVEGGSRVEIKGVQELELIPKVIEGEAKRQRKLMEVRGLLEERGAGVEDEIHDVTDVLSGSESKVISNALRKGSRVLAVVLRGFKGVLGALELGRYVLVAGLGGVMHTDELPGYGITQEEAMEVRDELGLGADDAFVLAAAERGTAEKGLKVVLERVKMAMRGVPEETRMANPDGSTSYMRPLPGAARMYPETDIPPVVLSEDRVERIVKALPELLEDKLIRYQEEYGLSAELAGQMVRSDQWPLFEAMVREMDLAPSVVANILVGTFRDLRRGGHDVDGIGREKLLGVFKAVAGGIVSKEAIPDVLTALSRSPGADVEDVIKELGYGAFGEEEVIAIVRKVLSERKDFVLERGSDAGKPLMGPVMKEVRGKADGGLVSEVLRRELMSFLKEASKKLGKRR